MNQKSERENFKKIPGLGYVVWTQAGFKKAIKEETQDGTTHRSGYPKAYPSLVEFYEGYAGYHYVEAICTPLSEAITRIQNQLAELIAVDAIHNGANRADTGSQD